MIFVSIRLYSVDQTWDWTVGLDCGTGPRESYTHHFGWLKRQGNIQLPPTQYASFSCNTAAILDVSHKDIAGSDIRSWKLYVWHIYAYIAYNRLTITTTWLLRSKWCLRQGFNFGVAKVTKITVNVLCGNCFRWWHQGCTSYVAFFYQTGKEREGRKYSTCKKDGCGSMWGIRKYMWED